VGKITFISKLTDELKKYKNETVNTKVDVLVTYGEYLNKIPKEYHDISIEILETAIYMYCLGIDAFYSYRNKIPNKTTTQPKIQLDQDVKALEKTRRIIHEKIFYKYFRYSDIEIPKMKEPTLEERNNYNDEYTTTIALYTNTPRVDIIKDAEDGKRMYDTYCVLTDMINDLKKQEFEIFTRETYYPHKKPTKSEIKDFLEIVNVQFSLKASHHQNQLLANL